MFTKKEKIVFVVLGVFSLMSSDNVESMRRDRRGHRPKLIAISLPDGAGGITRYGLNAKGRIAERFDIDMYGNVVNREDIVGFGNLSRRNHWRQPVQDDTAGDIVNDGILLIPLSANPVPDATRFVTQPPFPGSISDLQTH